MPASSLPIGGFIGLESRGEAPGRGADFGGAAQLRFWNARAALAHLLSVLDVQRVWLPAYICPEPALAAAEHGRDVQFYPVGDDLVPDGDALARDLRAGDAVLGVDYFGARSEILPDLAARFPEVVWIQDRAQALWPEANAWGDHILYSPRKVVGAPDGGVLVSRAQAIPQPPWASDDDQSRLEPARMRAEDPQGLRSDVWFPLYRAAEAAMTTEPRRISELSDAKLDALDIPAIVRRRRDNAEILLAAVGDAVLFRPDRLLNGTVLGVPVVVGDAAEVGARMAEVGIFCARHWPVLPSPAAAYPTEHALSRHLLTLPCDHRYDASDMARVADVFLARR